MLVSLPDLSWIIDVPFTAHVCLTVGDTLLNVCVNIEVPLQQQEDGYNYTTLESVKEMLAVLILPSETMQVALFTSIGITEPSSETDWKEVNIMGITTSIGI